MGSLCCRLEVQEPNYFYDSMDRLREEDPYASSLINTDSFKFETMLGRGAFGKVLLVSKKDTGQKFAMKVINKTRLNRGKQRLHAVTERNILIKIDCPFIVKLHYAFQTKEKLFLVMDYVKGGELFHLLRKQGRFREDAARFYAAEVVLALETIHLNGFIYRDIKPENILIDSDGHIKLVDFNLSTLVQENKHSMTFCGTPEYIAPEVLRAEPQTSALDYWSLGILIYEMLAGHPPFSSSNRQQLFKSIMNAPVKMKSYFSEDAIDLLNLLLVSEPADRLKEMRQLKRHPFFSKVDWKRLKQKLVDSPHKPKTVDSIEPFFSSSEEDEISPFSAIYGSSEHRKIIYEDFTFKNSLT